MDAKAKVVNMLAVFDFELAGWEDGSEPYENLWAARCEYVRLSGIEEAHELILTDHEAALAELAGEVSKLKDESLADVTGKLKAELAQRKAERQLQTLLTGLEALAGEWDQSAKYAGYADDAREAWTECANELRRTLASAGLEGKDGR